MSCLTQYYTPNIGYQFLDCKYRVKYLFFLLNFSIFISYLITLVMALQVKCILLWITILFSSLALDAQNGYEIVVPKLKNPWGFQFLPDNSILITEKSGQLIHFKNGIKTKVKGLPKIKAIGQGGLLDIKLHPNYSKNGWIYFSYISNKGTGNGTNTAIGRGQFKNGKIVNFEEIYKATPNLETAHHFGSRIEFIDDFIYFSIGDRGKRYINPQSTEKDGGKIYRLKSDGKIPNDNPFVKNKYAKGATYSFGHRNPQGMVVNPFTNQLWIHEHGPKGGDEINIIKAGRNYGWPKVTYGVNYDGTKITSQTSLPEFEPPIYHWTPSIAPSGMEFITSDKYPGWKGNLLIGSLKFRYITNCYIKDNKIEKEEPLLEGIGRVRSLNQGPAGYVYAGIENLGIIKILPINKVYKKK